jgi:uncharacterized Zn finger protein
MSFHAWKPYVSVAERKRVAEREMARLAKKGRVVTPVVIEGRLIAASFWGKSWCQNLEHYSDYASRLPRGRSYVRNGSVVDLQIAPGEVSAMVSGSSLYTVTISVAALDADRWSALGEHCAGAIDSLVDLLQGRLSKAIMARVCDPDTGLFPAPDEIDLDCSCPDSASMCKHIAAVLYGIGARLDHEPHLLFTLRRVDEKELVARASQGARLGARQPKPSKILKHAGMAELFGIDLALELPAAEEPPAQKAKKTARKTAAKKTAVTRTRRG